MRFGRTPAEQELYDSVLDFSRTLDDDLEGRSRDAVFSRKLWQECADFGILQLPMPEAFGGTDQGILPTIMAMEALGRGCRDQGLLFSIHAHQWSVVMPILAFGTDEQKAEYLEALTDGRLIGAHGMSEPDSGTDAFSLRARAEKDDDGYVLNGVKTFVTNAPVADLFLVFATVDPSHGMWGVTAFLIPVDTPGISVSQPLRKMGLKTSPMSEVILEDCRIPESYRLGAVGQGSVIFNHSMQWERSCILASQVGAMERQLEECLEYAGEREQFGRPIGNFQLVAARLADMQVRVETCRSVLYRAAEAMASGEGADLLSALAKLHISEAAVESALDAVRTHGGYGYMEEFGVERDLRDFLGGTLYSGTSDIQRLLIARHLGLRPQ